MPFIKLIKTINSHYLYDVNRDEIIKISKELYEFYKKKLLINTRIEKEIKALKQQGYLSDKHPTNTINPLSTFLGDYVDRKINQVTLQLTQNCNFRCSYCIYSEAKNEKQRSHSNNDMNFEMAKKILDFYLEHSIDNDNISIGLYGGEPLLKFNLIQQIVDYAENIFCGKNLLFSMTTNGSLLTNDIINFFTKHNVKLMVSLDGPESIHDRYRLFANSGEGSFNKVLSNLNMIKDNYPEYWKNVHISMVINPQFEYNSYNKLFNDYKYLREVSVHSSIVDDSYSYNKTKVSNSYITQSRYEIFLALLWYINKISDQIVSPIAKQEIETIVKKLKLMAKRYELPSNISHSGPCIPGQLRLFVNVFGEFFPCERVSETSTIMNIGNIKDGFYYNKIYDLLNFSNLINCNCKNCWAISFCTLCAKYADNGNAFSDQRVLKECHSIRKKTYDFFCNIIMFREYYEYYKK